MEKALEASKRYAEQARAQEDLARSSRKLEAEAYEKMQQESEKMRICLAQVWLAMWEEGIRCLVRRWGRSKRTRCRLGSSTTISQALSPSSSW
eukprot:750308-Hanusia_phi.AAC.5